MKQEITYDQLLASGLPFCILETLRFDFGEMRLISDYFAANPLKGIGLPLTKAQAREIILTRKLVKNEVRSLRMGSLTKGPNKENDHLVGYVWDTPEGDFKKRYTRRGLSSRLGDKVDKERKKIIVKKYTKRLFDGIKETCGN